MKKFIGLLTCLCLLQACGVRGIGGSYIGDLPKEDVISIIANDMATYISEMHAPGHTDIKIFTPKKNSENAFSVEFENALRRKGFEISTSADLGISYTIDALDDDLGDEEASWYIQIRFSDGLSLARSYDAQGLPEAGRTQVMRSKLLFYESEEESNEKHTIYGMEQ